jgi:hypothetical protein
MRRLGLGWALLFGLLSPVGALSGEEPIVPVYHEPHHRQVFQYGQTRILDLQIPPGTTTWFHTHDAPILYVSLSSSPGRTQVLGQDWNTPGLPPTLPAGGERPAPPPPAVGPRVTSTTSYFTQPLTHRLQNIGDRLTRAIVVLNQSVGDDGDTTAGTVGFEGNAELTNRWFRAFRQTLAPGGSTGPHRHLEPAVLVQTSEGRGLASGPMKFELNEPGQWAFFDGGSSHEIRNTGNVPLQIVEVELRQPRSKD